MEPHLMRKLISPGSLSVAGGPHAALRFFSKDNPVLFWPRMLRLVVGYPGSNAITCCHSALAAGLASSTCLQEHNDPVLIDTDEIGNGYTLLRFGLTDGCSNAPGFLPCSKSTMSSNCETSYEVIDCPAIDSLILNVSRNLPIKNSRNSPMQTLNTLMSRCNGTEIICQLEQEMMSTFQLANASVANTFFQQGISNLHLPFNKQGTTATDIKVDFMMPDCAGLYLDDLEVCGGQFDLDLNMTMAKLLPVDSSLAYANPPKMSTQAAGLSTIKRVERSSKSNRLRQRSLGKAPTRDLYKSSSFQLYEVIFSYPFSNSSKGASHFQAIPKEKFKELWNLFNQVAIGLAGGGLALVLFVASRMLSLNATFDSMKVMCLVRGFGLLWFSVALQRFGSVVKYMADVSSQARPQRKEHLARFRKEAQAVTFKACTLLMLWMVRLA